MAVGKLVTKAAAPVVEEVVSPFVKRLFKGVKVPAKTQKIVGDLNKIDQKTILSSIKKEPEIAEGWKNMFINAGSDDVEVKLSAFEELNQSLTRFRGEAKLQQKENRIDDMFYTDAKNTAPPNLTQMGQDIQSGKVAPPEQLSDLTGEINKAVEEGRLPRGPQTRFEAIALGTNKFDDEKGINRMIRRFRSEKLPLGRTEQTMLRPQQRGMTKRLQREQDLTLGKDEGFYLGTPKGSHAHHWNPLALMDKVVAGLSPKQSKAFIRYVEKELGIFSGNHIGNLRQLPENVHRRLHRQLEDLGYDPRTLKSFLGASLKERKAFMKKLKLDFDRLEEEIFSEMMINKGNQPGPQLP